MDPVQKVQLEDRPDIRQAAEAAAIAWRAYLRATQEPRPVPKAEASELGPGVQEQASKAKLQSSVHLRYEVDQEAGNVVIKVIDAETGEVLRTVPPEELARYLSQGGQWSEDLRLYL